MGYAFISYSTKNQSDADALRALFHKNGIRTWMAPGDIPAGSKYAQVINHAIKECACFVLLLTDAAQSSPWVAKEVERAVNHGKTIIPVKMEDLVLNEEFEFYISTDQIVAVQKIDESSEAFRKVLASVIALAGQDEVGQSEDEVAPATEATPEEEQDAAQTPIITENEQDEPMPGERKKAKRSWLTQVLGIFMLCLTVALTILLACEMTGGFNDSVRAAATIAEAALIFLIYSLCDLSNVISRTRRIHRYVPMIEKNKRNRMELLANAAGVPNDLAKKDLIYVSVRKYPGQMYFDHSTNLLVRTDKRADIRRGMIAVSKWYGDLLFGIGYFSFFAAMFDMAFAKHEYKLFVILAEVVIALLLFGASRLFRRQYAFCRMCLTIILGDGVCDIPLIAKKMNKKVKAIKTAIERFRSEGHLKNFYIDEQTQQIVFNE